MKSMDAVTNKTVNPDTETCLICGPLVVIEELPAPHIHCRKARWAPIAQSMKQNIEATSQDTRK